MSELRRPRPTGPRPSGARAGWIAAAHPRHKQCSLDGTALSFESAKEEKPGLTIGAPVHGAVLGQDGTNLAHAAAGVLRREVQRLRPLWRDLQLRDQRLCPPAQQDTGRGAMDATCVFVTSQPLHQPVSTCKSSSSTQTLVWVFFARSQAGSDSREASCSLGERPLLVELCKVDAQAVL